MHGLRQDVKGVGAYNPLAGQNCPHPGAGFGA
jgi:hypothetical protein